jgi:hypothetical protein
MKTRHRFIFTLPIEIFKEARQHAFDRNISLSLYILQSVVWRLDQEEK